VGENRGEDRLRVGDDGRETRRDELGGMEHAEESQARGAESHQDDQGPGAGAPRHRTAEEDSESDQAKACERGTHRGEGKMGCEIQTYGN
jgi:hypothetical protein